MRQPADEIGQQAAGLLLARVGNEPRAERERIVLASKLVLRESTAAAASSPTGRGPRGGRRSAPC